MTILNEKQANYIASLEPKQRQQFAKDALIKGQVLIEWVEDGKHKTHLKKVTTDEANEIWEYVRFLEAGGV